MKNCVALCPYVNGPSSHMREKTAMPECEVELLLAAAKQDVEAARQINYWVGRLLAAYEARRQLAKLSPAVVLDAMRHQP